MTELARDQPATQRVIAAHSLAVIITMADAAALKHRSDPARAAETMEQVSEVGRQALCETRRLVGVLGTDVAEGVAPSPASTRPEAPGPP